MIDPHLLTCLPERLHPVSQRFLEHWLSGAMSTPDFLRWLTHLLMHKVPVFWVFHAVHHSPHRLYWLNVGRFHPVEKAIQYVADALPFIVLGVAEPVLAVYFVFFAINGFFQHSNCSVRLGPLNYIVSGATRAR